MVHTFTWDRYLHSPSGPGFLSRLRDCPVDLDGDGCFHVVKERIKTQTYTPGSLVYHLPRRYFKNPGFSYSVGSSFPSLSPRLSLSSPSLIEPDTSDNVGT